MKCVKLLTIAALLVSASAVNAAGDAEEKGFFGKQWERITSAPGAVKDMAWGEGSSWRSRTKLGLYTLGLGAAGYGLTKVSDRARTAWEKLYLNKVSDRIEDTVAEAKDNPVSTEGAVVGLGTGAVVVSALWAYGYLDRLADYFKKDEVPAGA